LLSVFPFKNLVANRAKTVAEENSQIVTPKIVKMILSSDSQHIRHGWPKQRPRLDRFALLAT
jgi:hypothetical protein